jgi:hypothetical protein
MAMLSNLGAEWLLFLSSHYATLQEFVRYIKYLLLEI